MAEHHTNDFIEFLAIIQDKSVNLGIRGFVYQTLVL